MKYFFVHLGVCIITCSIWHLGYHFFFAPSLKHQIAAISIETGEQMNVSFRE